MLTNDFQKQSNRFSGKVHFAKREVIGIELDQWSPNGHNGVIHGHKYFSCKEGHGYFIRHDDVEKNLGSTRRRRKSRTASMMDIGVISKKLQIGDHIRLDRGKCGVVHYIGKASELFDDDANKDEDVIGIELDEWSPNGHDGKGFFKATKGRGYFARKNSVLNIIQPALFGDSSNTEDQVEIASVKRKMAKIEKKLHEISILEEKQKRGEPLDQQQLSKCARKKYLKEQLVQLQQDVALLEKGQKSLETEESTKSFNRKRRGSVNKEESLKNIQIGDRVRLVRGKTGIVRYVVLIGVCISIVILSEFCIISLI